MVGNVKIDDERMRLKAKLAEGVRSCAPVSERINGVEAIEASTEYLDWLLPQLSDLDKAVAAADCDEFASDAEVSAVFECYGVSAAPLATGYKSR